MKTKGAKIMHLKYPQVFNNLSALLIEACFINAKANVEDRYNYLNPIESCLKKIGWNDEQGNNINCIHL